MDLADASGLDAVTMRAVAQALDVQPMALYHHVANKSALLDGIVDLVFAEIELPVPGGDWREQVRRRAVSARDVLLRHPWALAVLDSRRSPGPATLRHHEAKIATLRQGGFSVDRAARAYALLDAFVYGFVLQECALPLGADEPVADLVDEILGRIAPDEYPYLTEMALELTMQPGYTFGNQYDDALELVLDALTRLRG
jgi:AcrR family transcriptional regulator